MNKLKEYNKLVEQGYLKCKKHDKYPLLLWSYTAKTFAESYWTDITKVCRSLVTDLECNIVSNCMPKFFNWEENLHIPTDHYVVEEKMDGQLVYCFIYNNELIIRSSSEFDNDVTRRARILLEQNSMGISEGVTYCLELTGYEVKIVVDYPWQNKLFFITCFDNTTHKEIPLKEDNYPKVSSLIRELTFDKLKSLNKEGEEGYVVKYSNGQRCKIKFDNYVLKHFYRFNLSTTLVWKCLRDDRLGELLDYLPHEYHEAVYSYLGKLLLQVDTIKKKLEYNAFKLKGFKGSSFDFYIYSQTFEYPSLSLATFQNRKTSQHIYRIVKPEYKLLSNEQS